MTHAIFRQLEDNWWTIFLVECPIESVRYSVIYFSFVTYASMIAVFGLIFSPHVQCNILEPLTIIDQLLINNCTITSAETTLTMWNQLLCIKRQRILEFFPQWQYFFFCWPMHNLVSAITMIVSFFLSSTLYHKEITKI